MGVAQSCLRDILLATGAVSRDFLEPFRRYPDEALFEELQSRQLFSESFLQACVGEALGYPCVALTDLARDETVSQPYTHVLVLYETESQVAIAVCNPFIEPPLRTTKTLIRYLIPKHDWPRATTDERGLCEDLLRQANQDGATDIHFFEQADHTSSVSFRIQGVLKYHQQLSKKHYQTVKQVIKLKANLDLSVAKIPQDGYLQWRIADQAYDARVAVFPTLHGEDMVCRLFTTSTSFCTLQELGAAPHKERLIQDMLQCKTGLILVVGPTGSGKTTTLYTLLRSLQAEDRGVIVTLEDPVENRLYGIRQSSIAPIQGYTYAAGLKAVLRQDPDVIMLGEIRDKDTAAIALEAAYTGHLVVSSLHTHSVHATLMRLKSLGCDPFLVGYALRGIIAQELCVLQKGEPRQLKQEILSVTETVRAEHIYTCERVSALGTYLK